MKNTWGACARWARYVGWRLRRKGRYEATVRAERPAVYWKSSGTRLDDEGTVKEIEQ